MFLRWLSLLPYNQNFVLSQGTRTFLGLSLSGHSVKLRSSIHWAKPDFLQFSQNEQNICLLLSPKEVEKSDVLSHIKLI